MTLTLARTIVIIAALLLMLATPLYAASVFDGEDPLDDIWGANLNWSDDLAPTSADDVDVDSGFSVMVDLTGTPVGAFAKSVDLNDGATLNVTDSSLNFGNKAFKIGHGGSVGTAYQSGGLVAGVGNGAHLDIGSDGAYFISGGILDLDDELKIDADGRLEITGSPTIIVDDKLKFEGDNATLVINLVGSTLPQITIGNELDLGDDAVLEVNTGSWTGGSTISLFDVLSSDIKKTFAGVYVDGQLLDASEYQVNSDSITIFSVPEPNDGILLLTLLSSSVLIWRRQT